MLNIIQLLFISPIGIFLLILNCFFIILFKKYLGPISTFYVSIFFLFISIINFIFMLYFNLSTGSYVFIDLGHIFFTLDCINSNFILIFDNLTLLLSIIVSLLTIVALFFGIEYMARELFINRLIYLLNLFATSVIFLFCVYDFFLILIAWELIGLFSFFLVNFYSLTVYTTKSSLKTFIFSRLSDMFLFFSFNLCILVFNSTDLSIIFLKTPFFIYHNFLLFGYYFNFLGILTFFISLASCIKAAQFGFHVWLPDAMNAPTPASSLIHSSTLVIMGIYLIIRFNLIFEFSLYSNYFLILLGSLTISIGSVIAIFQTDIKKLVAYSTISQMGYLVAGCGFFAYEETVIYLLMHALNKAFLFIIVGYTVHFFNSNTDLRQMGGMFLYSFDLSVYYFILGINLIGLPFSSGFYSKEFLLFQIFDTSYFSTIIKSFWLISFLFTPIYIFILIFYVNFNFKKNIYKNYNLNKNYYYFWNNINFFDINYITSKSTKIILFLFFIILNFFGDYFFLILIDYIYQNDSFYVKNYLKYNYKSYLAINMLNSNFFQNLYIFILIINFISIKYIFINFYKNNYNFYKYLYLLDSIFIIFLIFIFL